MLMQYSLKITREGCTHIHLPCIEEQFLSCIFIVDRPTLTELVCFQNGTTSINIPQQIGTKYIQFGILLLNDSNGDRVYSIEHKRREHAEQINIKILQEWIKGEGKQPVSWKTLTEVLRKIDLSWLATEIEEAKAHVEQVTAL